MILKPRLAVKAGNVAAAYLQSDTLAMALRKSAGALSAKQAQRWSMSADRLHVRFWHLADMKRLFADVCFRGQSGHSKVKRQCPLMTRCGHAANRR